MKPTRVVTFTFLALLVGLNWLPTSVLATAVAEQIAAGDRAWAERARGHQGTRAAAEPIQQAIDAYRAALEAAPESLEARWRLLRALYFKGEHVLTDREERLDLFLEGIEIADAGRRQVEARYRLEDDALGLEPEEVATAIGKDPLAAEIFFWSSTHWGLWGRYTGKIKAARQGVATKIRKFAEIVILLDDTIENAGGHRVLGRLHAEAPKIPFITGWVDRDRAVEELRRAHELAPGDLLTQLFLAEALLDYRPAAREEGLAMLAALVDSQPDPGWLVEDTKAIADARARLAEIDD